MKHLAKIFQNKLKRRCNYQYLFRKYNIFLTWSITYYQGTEREMDINVLDVPTQTYLRKDIMSRSGCPDENIQVWTSQMGHPCAFLPLPLHTLDSTPNKISKLLA